MNEKKFQTLLDDVSTALNRGNNIPMSEIEERMKECMEEKEQKPEVPENPYGPAYWRHEMWNAWKEGKLEIWLNKWEEWEGRTPLFNCSQDDYRRTPEWTVIGNSIYRDKVYISTVISAIPLVLAALKEYDYTHKEWR